MQLPTELTATLSKKGIFLERALNIFLCRDRGTSVRNTRGTHDRSQQSSTTVAPRPSMGPAQTWAGLPKTHLCLGMSETTLGTNDGTHQP